MASYYSNKQRLIWGEDPTISTTAEGAGPNTLNRAELHNNAQNRAGAERVHSRRLHVNLMPFAGNTSLALPLRARAIV